MSAQLTESFEDLTEWAKKHGPDHLKYAAERGFTVKAGTMDVVAERVAKEFGGRFVREEERRRGRIRWSDRSDASEWRLDRNDVCSKINDLLAEAGLPRRVLLETSSVQRFEELPDGSERRLKYTGVVITVSHPATEPRYVVVNLESSQTKKV